MKLVFLAVLTFLVIAGTHVESGLFSIVGERTQTAATFINDSVIIGIGEGGEDEVVVEADSDATPSGDSSGDMVVFDDDSDLNDDVIDEVVVTITTDDESSDAEGEDGESGGDSGNSTTSETTVSADSVLNTLTGNQAITGGSTGASSGAGAGGGTSVSGEKTRAALLSRGITSISIPAAPKGNDQATVSRAPYSRKDLALIVSAALIQNPTVDDVFFTTNSLQVTYKAQGRLLFALPLTYTTRLDLKFDESSAKERVRVTFPWYKFFMWTGVSKNKLRTQIDSVITAVPAGREYDRAAHVFTEVAALLESTRGFRTVQ